MSSDIFAQTFRYTDGRSISLDAAEFDAVAEMDQLLGEDPNLEDVLDLLEVLQHQISLVDQHVLRAVRAQSQQASRAHQELAAAQGDIVSLNLTIRDIEQQANMTQEKVDVICKDIRAMDHAKRHLTQSISTLENFGTLSDAVRELKDTGNDSAKYAVNAAKLESVLCLMDNFEAYHHVSKMASLRDTVDVITKSLHSQLLREFQIQWVITDPFQALAVGPDADFDDRQRVKDAEDRKIREDQGKFRALADAALMADALNRRTHCRDQILAWVMDSSMNNFRATELDLPRGSTPLHDHFRRLFDWLLNILERNRYFEKQWAVFPTDWQARKELALRFCAEIKQHLRDELRNFQASTEGTDVDSRSEAVLQAWRTTRDFEGRLMASVEGLHVAAGTGGESDAVKQRLRSYLQPHQSSAQQASVFDGMLREVFHEQLQIVIDWHDGELRKVLRFLLDEDAAAGWRSTKPELQRLDSSWPLLAECRKQSDNAFTVIDRSEQCVEAFVGVLDAVLQAYVEALTAQVPRSRHDGKRNLQVAELSLEAVHSVCAIAGSAAFFEQNIPQMQQFLRDKCGAASAGAPVELVGAARAFEQLGSRALNTLFNGLMTQLARFVDGPLLPGAGITVMSANMTAWKVGQTGDTSAYAKSIADVLHTWGGVLYKRLASKDPVTNEVDDMAFEHLCNKLLRSFVRHLLECGIMKLKRLNHLALTQLSVDLSAIRDALKLFPVTAYAAANDDDRPAAAERFEAYQAEVGARMLPLVNLVKVLQISDDAAFLSAYKSILPQDYQAEHRMQQLLQLLDLPRDAQIARINAFKAGSSLTMRATAAQPQAAMALVPAGSGAAGSATARMASVANNWTANMNVSNMSARGATMLSGMQNSLTTVTGKSLQARTESFMGKGSALFSNVRGKFGGAKAPGASTSGSAQ